MPTTLVSFLGRARQDPKTGYRQATYRFPSGTEIATPFFGLALRRALRPNRLLLLGTSGSMWDVLVDHLADAGEDEDLRLELIEASGNAAVDADLLARASPLIERALQLPCDCRLIPYGRDATEQAAILETIARAAPEGRVALDLTHGFRHLAALGLLSAFFLERLEHLDISGLYYGALDMTEAGRTPVVRLDGLLAIQRWIDALDRFDQGGDYGVFSPLLIADGIAEDKARCLEMAAFHERTFNLADAARKIRSFLPALDPTPSGTTGLFRDRLRQRLDWALTGTLADHQRRLAHLYLRRKDFVRAAVFGWEAVIGAECKREGLDPNDFSSDRKRAEDALRARLEAAGQPWDPSPHNRLKALRNALAHGNPPKWAPLRPVLQDPGRLQETLATIFRETLR